MYFLINSQPVIFFVSWCVHRCWGGGKGRARGSVNVDEVNAVRKIKNNHLFIALNCQIVDTGNGFYLGRVLNFHSDSAKTFYLLSGNEKISSFFERCNQSYVAFLAMFHKMQVKEKKKRKTLKWDYMQQERMQQIQFISVRLIMEASCQYDFS